jgi:hypothetical protein
MNAPDAPVRLQIEHLVPLELPVTLDGNGDRLAGLARVQGEHAGPGVVVFDG